MEPMDFYVILKVLQDEKKVEEPVESFNDPQKERVKKRVKKFTSEKFISFIVLL